MSINPSSSVGEAALGLAGLGWPVIPLHHVREDGGCSCGKNPCPSKPGKHPRTRHGLKDGTTEQATIRGWWGRWPQANVAVCTGAASGLFVVGPDGTEGIGKLADLQRNYGTLPRTVTAQTGGGGQHWYFRWPPAGEIQNRANHRGLPIDVRGEGGYVVAPPSRNQAGAYVWLDPPTRCDVAEAPGWLLDWCRPDDDGQGAKPSGFKAHAGGGTSIVDRAIAYLAKVPEAISGEGGHDRTLEAARSVVYGFDLGREVGYQLLATHYNCRCSPPWSEKELRHKCEEADTVPFGKRRGWLLTEDRGPRRQGPVSSDSDSSPWQAADEDKGANAEPKGSDPAPPPWEPPIPLSSVPDVPAFPVALLPVWQRGWVEAVALALQVPADLPAMLCLALTGAAVARNYRVMVREGWSEPLNLFTVTALPPGDRKSAVFAAAIRPVETFESEERARLAGEIAAASAERRILERQLRRAEQAVAEAAPAAQAELRAAARTLAVQLAGLVVPDAPQFWCDDASPESVSTLLARQGGRMLAASPEGTPFEIAKGRYSDPGKANFEVYLKGHAGDSVRVNRQGREAELIERPALSAALAVQPDVIRGLAEVPAMRGRGFLGRWLYSMPVSLVGARDVAARPVPEAVRRDYDAVMLGLWRLTGALDAAGRPYHHWLRFSPEATGVLEDLMRWLEPQLGPGGDLYHLAGWGNKLAGAAARIAAVWHLSDAVRNSGPRDAPVSDRTVADACLLARGYFLPHARAAFAVMGADERVNDARHLLRWARGHAQDRGGSGGRGPVVSKRTIYKACQHRWPTVEGLDPVLSLLARHHYVRALPPPKGQPGRPSMEYEFNPIWLAVPDSAPNPQNPPEPTPAEGV
jgi:hypothetical protein